MILSDDGPVFVTVGLSGPQFDSSGDYELFIYRFDGIFLLGDVNFDEAINFFDIAPFIDVLQSGKFRKVADINQDGFVNFFDIAPFIDLLQAQ